MDFFVPHNGQYHDKNSYLAIGGSLSLQLTVTSHSCKILRGAGKLNKEESFNAASE
jgi:hypothetical protein